MSEGEVERNHTEDGPVILSLNIVLIMIEEMTVEDGAIIGTGTRGIIYRAALSLRTGLSSLATILGPMVTMATRLLGMILVETIGRLTFQEETTAAVSDQKIKVDSMIRTATGEETTMEAAIGEIIVGKATLAERKQML